MNPGPTAPIAMPLRHPAGWLVNYHCIVFRSNNLVLLASNVCAFEVVSPISKATTNNDEQSSNELGQTALLTPANHLDETSVSKIDETLSQTAATNCEKREAAKKVFAIASPVIIETSPQNVGNETKAVENISEEIVKVHSRNSSKLSKYDTLDRVQDYLRATPLTITHSALDSVPQRQNSNSSSVSLS